MRLALALALVVLSVGCGSGSTAPDAQSTRTTPNHPAAANPFPDDPQIIARATTRTQREALDLLARDIDAMRATSRKAPAHTLKGTPSTRRTTSRFIDHLETSTIDDLSKNRLIDHAAAAVAISCDQCFQQLEAMRPIPAIAH